MAFTMYLYKKNTANTIKSIGNNNVKIKNENIDGPNTFMDRGHCKTNLIFPRVSS